VVELGIQVKADEVIDHKIVMDRLSEESLNRLLLKEGLPCIHTTAPRRGDKGFYLLTAWVPVELERYSAMFMRKRQLEDGNGVPRLLEVVCQALPELSLNKKGHTRVSEPVEQTQIFWRRVRVRAEILVPKLIAGEVVGALLNSLHFFF